MKIKKKHNLVICVLVLLMGSMPFSYASDIYILTSTEWSRPRSADYVRQLPSVKAIVNAWIENKNKQIEIRYPGGEEGKLWAVELKDWMVSLGILSEKIVLQPGFGEADKIGLELIAPY